jgi:hypothetical protein
MPGRIHSIRAAALAWALAASTLAVARSTAVVRAEPGPAAQQAQPAAADPAAVPTSFKVLIRSLQVGAEDIVVTRSPDGWTILSTGRIGNLVNRQLEVSYDAGWKPRSLALNANTGGTQLLMRIAVEGTAAQSELWQGTARRAWNDTIDPEAILLPNPFFGAYAALAARLRDASPGTRLPIYQGQGSSFHATVGDSTVERLQTVGRLIEARRTGVTFALPDGPPVDAEIWADEEGRLLRVNVPTQFVDVVREDLAAVSTRRVLVSREGDEQVRVPANGFSLAGTLSAPGGSPGPRHPAVILVSGPGPTDRDETVAGIPIFGQLASQLADAGLLVLRYDKRGIGQSGGREESATLVDYVDDLRAAVKFLRARRDVDRQQIAVVGYGEGGAIAMLAAEREKHIAALVLVASIGVTGAELNLAQVTHAMSRSPRSEAQKQATIDLQKRIQTAVLTGEGWDAIPAHLRQQAEVPWFQSFLAFDPAEPIEDIRQPILVVQGLLDTQMKPDNADRLETLAKSRRRRSTVDVVRVPDVNHLLVPAETGEVDEYASLSDEDVSPAVSDPIAGWLKKVFLTASR